MPKTSTLISPIDPQYTGHRDAEERRRQTRKWLAQAGAQSRLRE